MFNEPIEIDELIELSNQSNKQVKDGLVVEAAKITITLILKRKNKLAVRSMAIKKEVKNALFW